MLEFVGLSGDLLMVFLILAGVLLASVIIGWLLLRRPLRVFVEELHVDSAREQFRLRRERLEARFVSALGRLDPVEGLRWEDAHWHDEVYWARDRQTRTLLALIGVHFDSELLDGIPLRRFATAVFDYRKGEWRAEGKRLDEVRPNEAVGRNQRFEPVIVTQPRPRRVVKP